MEQRRRAEDERLRHQREAEEKQRAKEAADRAFRAGQRQALGELKGVTGGDIEIKTGTKFFAGEIKDDRTALGIKEVLNDPLASDPHLPRTTAELATQWHRADAALFLSSKAAHASTASEATYLTEQAAQAMNGGALGVQVPARWRLRDSMPESVQQAYQGLICSTADETQRTVSVRKQIPILLAERQAAQQRLELARNNAMVPTPIKSPVDSASQLKISSTSSPDAVDEALQAALTADAAADAALSAARASLMQAEATLARNNALAEKLGTDPNAALASEILKQLQSSGPATTAGAEHAPPRP